MTFVATAPTVIVSLWLPPRMLSTFEIVATFQKLPSVTLSVPTPRSIETSVHLRAEGYRIGRRSTDQRFDIRDRQRVGEGAQCQHVVAVAEVDRAVHDLR